MQKIGQCQSKSGLQLEPSSLLRPHSLARPIVFQLLASFHSNVAASTAIVVSSAGSWSIIGIDLFWLVGNFFLLPECECVGVFVCVYYWLENLPTSPGLKISAEFRLSPSPAVAFNCNWSWSCCCCSCSCTGGSLIAPLVAFVCVSLNVAAAAATTASANNNATSNSNSNQQLQNDSLPRWIFINDIVTEAYTK